MRCVLFFNMATSFFRNMKFAYIVRESVFVYIYMLCMCANVCMHVNSVGVVRARNVLTVIQM